MLIRSMDKGKDEQEADIELVQKWIPPCGMPKECAKISSTWD
jgi:hypothetical protein